jgi:hypothetical protein
MNTNYKTVINDAPPDAHSWERPEVPLSQTNDKSHHAAARGLDAVGLHPLPAVITLGADAMLFGGTIATGGAIWPLALVVAAVLGFITYRAQMRFYGDDREAAMIKALAVALLTAIPTSLPGFLTVPSAVVGVIHTLRRKE